MRLLNALFSKIKTEVKSKNLSDARRYIGASINIQSKVSRTLNGDTGQPLYSSLFEEYQGLAYRCINLIASNIANAKIFVYKKDNQTENSEPDSHLFLKLINNPNPKYTFAQMLNRAEQRNQIIGNEYWWINRNKKSNLPVELWPLRVTYNNQMTAIIDNNGIAAQWKYKLDETNFKIYESKDILHFKKDSPLDDIYGSGVIWAGSWIFDKLREINKYHLKYFRNDAMKKFIIESDNDMGDEQLEEAREHFERMNAGEAKNTWIFNKGFHAKVLSNTPVESDYFNTYNSIQDDICSLFGVPPSKVSRIADVNRANSVSAEYDFYNDMLKTIANQYSETLTKFLHDNYPESQDYIVQLKLNRPQDTDRELRVQELLTKTKSISKEELRIWGEYPKDIPDGDFSY